MSLGPLEIIVILVVALLIFGPKNLPKLGSALGKTVKNVREGMEGDEGTDKDEEGNRDGGFHRGCRR
jgi:sec-independent protein translocase protein TatA